MPPDLERRMWKQLKGAFSIDRIVMVPIVEGEPFDQYPTMEEALECCAGNVVFLEPGGFKSMYDLPNPQEEDVVLVIGNTQQGNMYMTVPPNAYSIRTVNKTHLYGTNAAAIALAFMVGQ